MFKFRSVQMSVFVVRAFIRMRAALSDNRGLARKLAELESEIKARLDVHESAIVDTLRRLMKIIDPPDFPAPLHSYHETDGADRVRPIIRADSVITGSG